MKRLRPLLIIIVIVAAAVVAWRLFGPRPRTPYLSGYIVGDNLDLAAPVAGTLESVWLVDGQRVSAGQPAFRIEPATLEAEGEQASANIRANETQISTAEANLRQAEANVAANQAVAENARQNLARLESVKRDDPAAIANTDLDKARAALREANANVVAAKKTADARRAEIAEAKAKTRQAVGGKRSVDIKVGQLSPAVPAAGRVEQVYFQVGEWVPANQAIVSIIPDHKVKVRFFVPEAKVSHYRPGKTVRFSCDGCKGGLNARIGYVSPDSEFTPPIIFSRDSRDRMVFMVEAYPTNPDNLNPGQPVEVEPLP
ncbi:MAG TPA: HlyD family efflux transporter periplasmic adaptor subunit [Sphingomicrobium sp.]|jgi:HlyD family secretion protein|nr:HlyD family efflux transporter periplasmic adaptor subunit [Sphingomicrobium sp.]